jgi:hypothetical protein
MSVIGSGFDGENVIDIKLEKLVEWLTSRRFIQPGAIEDVKALHKHVATLLADIPFDAKESISAIMTPNSINYADCIAVLAALEKFTASRGNRTHNLFGSYATPLLKSWSGVVATYEDRSDNLYIAESARTLIQLAWYDIPVAQRSAAGAIQQAADIDARATALTASSERSLREFTRECGALGLPPAAVAGAEALAASTAMDTAAAATSAAAGESGPASLALGVPPALSAQLEGELMRVNAQETARVLTDAAASTRRAPVLAAALYYSEWCARTGQLPPAGGSPLDGSPLERVLPALARLLLQPTAVVSEAAAGTLNVAAAATNADAEGADIDWGDGRDSDGAGPSTVAGARTRTGSAEAASGDGGDGDIDWSALMSTDEPAAAAEPAAAGADADAAAAAWDISVIDESSTTAAASAASAAGVPAIDLSRADDRQAVACDLSELDAFLRARLTDAAAAGSAANSGLLAPFAPAATVLLGPALAPHAAAVSAWLPAADAAAVSATTVSASAPAAVLCSWLGEVSPALRILTDVQGPLQRLLLVAASVSFRRRVTRGLARALQQSRALAARANGARARAAALRADTSKEAQKVTALKLQVRSLKTGLELAVGQLAKNKVNIFISADGGTV